MTWAVHNSCQSSSTCELSSYHSNKKFSNSASFQFFNSKINTTQYLQHVFKLPQTQPFASWSLANFMTQILAKRGSLYCVSLQCLSWIRTYCTYTVTFVQAVFMPQRMSYCKTHATLHPKPFPTHRHTDHLPHAHTETELLLHYNLYDPPSHLPAGCEPKGPPPAKGEGERVWGK